jgi:uncharacterized protein
LSERVFVDTGAWFAAVVPWDANHVAVSAWLHRNQRAMATTDYVVDETLTLLRARGEGRRAIALGEKLFAGQLSALHFLTPTELLAAWQVFRDYRDKQWSFTDCTSKVVIEQHGCTRALTFDEHFRQFGTVVIERLT